MRNLILISLLISGFLFVVSSCNSEQNTASHKLENSANTQASKAQNDLLLVKYHADWCGSCKTLTPMLAELNGKLAGKKVKYVELDFTDETTISAAKSQASMLGLEQFLTEKQKTGYVAIIDANSKKELGRLTKTQSVGEMYKQVINNL